jgi:hypothetical protein
LSTYPDGELQWHLDLAIGPASFLARGARGRQCPSSKRRLGLEDIAFQDDTWAKQGVNLVTIVAWAGVGKSTLVSHWLRQMAAEGYRSAELFFGWSFCRQGTSGDTSSADEFLDAALAWFGDPDPRLGRLLP